MFCVLFALSLDFLLGTLRRSFSLEHVLTSSLFFLRAPALPFQGGAAGWQRNTRNMLISSYEVTCFGLHGACAKPPPPAAGGTRRLRPRSSDRKAYLLIRTHTHTHTRGGIWLRNNSTHTHTHTYVCLCVCVCLSHEGNEGCLFLFRTSL